MKSRVDIFTDNQRGWETTTQTSLASSLSDNRVGCHATHAIYEKFTRSTAEPEFCANKQLIPHLGAYFFRAADTGAFCYPSVALEPLSHKEVKWGKIIMQNFPNGNENM
jgi:hypothetical protein